MKISSDSNLLKRLVSVVGMASASVVLAFPVGAQTQGGAVNPNPSIFNEPPYNRTRSPQTAPPTSPIPSTPSSPAPATGASSGTVVGVAAANSSFKTLTAALKAAGLTETLSGTGPFTVFAPTDQAFEAFAATLPKGGLQKLLSSQDPQIKQLLVKILTYHVIPGKITSTDLKSGPVKSVEGGAINVKTDSSAGVMVNNAKVVQPDVQADNGVIHIIDQVIIPPDLQ